MLDKDLISQLSAIFESLSSTYTLHCVCDTASERGKEMAKFVTDFCSSSPKLEAKVDNGSADDLQFCLLRDSKPLGITFKGIPGGHEFNTLLLAILNADGKGKNLPDEAVLRRIRSIKGAHTLQVFVSLTCTNCPDVAQACNVIAISNPAITTEIIDGGQFTDLADSMGIQAVPTLYADLEVLTVGRTTLAEIIGALETRYGVDENAEPANDEVHEVDVLILGGGPAGASAAIYSARKGLNTAIIAAEAGGSVNQTGAIENLITTRETTGAALAGTLRSNAAFYGAQLYEGRVAEKVELDGDTKVVTCAGGEKFTSPVLIVATGSRPRKINVPGEAEYVGHGVAFCPHCDGPMFKGKDVAVIGGGNSGIEAAIDLAGICKSVRVYEFLDVLKADDVLVKRAKSLPNVELFTASAVKEILGDGKKVVGLKVQDRASSEVKEVKLDGVFVQIGIIPNSEIFTGIVDINKRGEIETDRNCRTNVKGIYAAGDVANGPYKQIVTGIGEGATAALTAFDDSIRS